MMAECMEVGSEYILPDFKEYMERELNYSRCEPPGYTSEWNGMGWVFWNRQDDDPTLSYGKDARNQLCSYRMGMCREYNNKFYADAESGEEQLGLPGRVFLNKLPECTPDVWHYTLKEYPQRDLAFHCDIYKSWALPVFEQSSHTCVGVLEIAYNDLFEGMHDYVSWDDKEFIGRMCENFQEFGLRCFDGYKHYEIQDGDENKALTTAFQELNMVYESVCKIHDLPLALTWVSCRSCNQLLQSQFQFSVLDYCDEEVYFDCSVDFGKFIEVSKVCHLRKGQVAGRILSFPNLLYCSDVKQFHIDEFPLVPFARCCKLGGWFTMCLQSSYTGDELYVLEFFLPKSTENDENILTKLRFILGTMEKNFKTFKLASGQGLGEALSVEVIDFLYGQRSHSTRFIPSLDSYDQPSMDPSRNGQNVVTAERNILVNSGQLKLRGNQMEEYNIQKCVLHLNERNDLAQTYLDEAARHMKRATLLGDNSKRSTNSSPTWGCSHKYPVVTVLSRRYKDKNKALTAALKELEMVLRSVFNTGGDSYILEFFLPASIKDDESSWNSLSMILGTMIENSKTFNLASGQKVGEVLSAEVIDFQNGGKLHFVQTIQAIRSFPFIEPLKHGGVTMELNSLDQPSLDGINYGVKVLVRQGMTLCLRVQEKAPQ
ncbi:hypothetical protein RHSIM_RhsimUnG0007400 [Rhododendron simsii]|uniref:NLP1-9 GAF domain-containing protein n=1 Tax=Rhododendron simsii TaxID=118357 RepID=A0A834G044_RHOSS|nr:hypothetical protein RHSIM_RhsimUnG0007400 [Rhododendron simsii]